VYAFRVTRNFDIEIDEEEAEDLLQQIQQELGLILDELRRVRRAK
jgi:polyphosphate kinase